MNQQRPRSSFRVGFSLIELLVVVGILAILAGIGLANYMSATVRTKVSRVKAEMRTLATAIEAYSTDHNAAPRMAHCDYYKDSSFDWVEGVPVRGVVSRVLSTPIAYITDPFRLDPFMDKNTSAPLEQRLYTYQDLPAYVLHNPKSEFWPKALRFYGRWRIASVGPDQQFIHGFDNCAQLPYDPSNGVVSLGNIWYAPGPGFEQMPPVPDLLGQH